ncbi:MAG: TrkH family potassium uptake protein [Lachnospiraceae bacterium]|nr:TrkH family potassium uptake protein [Lachnospiraceae bacterium]
MNYASIFFILGRLLEVEAIFLAMPALVSLIYGEMDCLAFLAVAVLCVGTGLLFSRRRPEKFAIYAREGFVTVSLGWIVISALGALPFMITRDIPVFTDAFFETVSGFTTTGASILSDVESLSKGCLFWRSLTHWIGGMGIFVFMIAILPATGSQNMHLLQTESPGPEVGKLVPRLRDTAMILYKIYFAMTLIVIIALLLTGMPLFDSLTLAFGTAGTGGFAIRGDSIASYSALQQVVIAFGMLMFGVNFNFYYFLTLGKSVKEAFRLEEVRAYLAIVGVSTLLIVVNSWKHFSSAFDALNKSFFQVSSIITTTGYGTADFDQWPTFSKIILVGLMAVGACAGSTGGGIKVSRIQILFKAYRREMNHFIHPRLVRGVRMNGKIVKEETVSGVKGFLATYVMVLFVSVLLISIEGEDIVTNLTAVMATIGNIGPGLSRVGPSLNYGFFSHFSKFVLIFDMLAGRLELYPMLLLFSPATWRRK